MQRKVSRPKAGVLLPLRLPAKADRWRRSWVWVVNRRDLRRYRRWRPKPDEEWLRDHCEQIGLDQLCETIESVVTKMREDEIVEAKTSHAR